MVTVARGIDAPIKLLSPKPGSKVDFAMLGLGDVVVPGLVIALCLRFDLYRHVQRNPGKDVTRYSRFNRIYFWTGIVSYIIGLVTTMVVMHHFKAAQPALLYLSPACSEFKSDLYTIPPLSIAFGPLLLALVRGEIGLLWKYTEGSDNEEKKDDTIEAPSEAAMKARQAAKGQVDATDVPETVDEQEKEEDDDVIVVEDDSWMEDSKGVSTGIEASKAKKRKGGKKK